MGQTLVYKIFTGHLVDGKIAAGRPIGIRIDQTLTQDATGTTAFLLFEAMGTGPVRNSAMPNIIEEPKISNETGRVKTQLSVSYIDHNIAGFG
ncbi:unnamed protein product, partial [marine sediment metagenome]